MVFLFVFPRFSARFEIFKRKTAFVLECALAFHTFSIRNWLLVLVIHTLSIVYRGKRNNKLNAINFFSASQYVRLMVLLLLFMKGF